ncbi:hypothetical protein ACJBU6_11301 [Exserohilum turcicum]
MNGPNLPWPLIRLAVLCSEEAYNAAVMSSAQQCNTLERTFVSQQTVDFHGKVVIVALSGTKGVRDWMVNLKHGPCDPKDVLGQQNSCHGGFLKASRSLIDPLATYLDEYKDRSTLLFTGHSAGAATASILYAHVLSEVTSQLVTVANTFTNIHCILFGCPPISTQPLQHHRRESNRSSSSIFLSFLNDGDPIIKADVRYIASRLKWPKATHPHLYSPRRDTNGKEMALLASLVEKRSYRSFLHSGSLFILTSGIDSAPLTSIKNVDNDELDRMTDVSWRVHSVKVYKERIESCEKILVRGCIWKT